jgi:hypothetical protein
MGNKNGRASQANKGNTGAPGDETSLGEIKTCMNCHNQGPITATVNISVLDGQGQPVTQYQPGQSYTVRVVITATGATVQGYGFQLIGLRDAGNTDLDGFTDVNPNNYKLASISGGRTYAEHDNISGTNTFNVKWTAPAAGTGSVTFYASGNGVNANGTTSGDGAGKHSLQLTEAGSVHTQESAGVLQGITLLPNPLSDNGQLRFEGVPAGTYQIRAFHGGAGKVWETTVWLDEREQQVLVPSAAWAAGIYYVQVANGEQQAIVKAVRL